MSDGSKRETIEVVVGVVEGALHLAAAVMRDWRGPSIDIADLRQRTRKALDAIEGDLTALDDAEQRELDAAVDRE